MNAPQSQSAVANAPAKAKVQAPKKCKPTHCMVLSMSADDLKAVEEVIERFGAPMPKLGEEWTGNQASRTIAQVCREYIDIFDSAVDVDKLDDSDYGFLMTESEQECAFDGKADVS